MSLQSSFLKRGLIEGAIMGCTQGTTSLAERLEPQGRRTESLYYLSLIAGKKAGQRTQTRVIPTKSAFLYFHPEAAHRRATYPRVWPPAEIPYRLVQTHPFQIKPSATQLPPGPPHGPRGTSSLSRSSCSLDPISTLNLSTLLLVRTSSLTPRLFFPSGPGRDPSLDVPNRL